MIERKEYLNKFIRNMWSGDIKVITGIRRCGKSTLLFEIFKKYLLKNGVLSGNIIEIQLDQRKNFKFRDPILLCEYVEEVINSKNSEKFYLFIDEVQFTNKATYKGNTNTEVSIYDMLNELKSYKNLDTYVTGSNSRGLSKDIATEFRGRATQIHVHPLSFSEFYSTQNSTFDIALEDYMIYGGLPRVLSIDSSEDKNEYLKSLFQEVYIKDILERNNIENIEALEDILDFLASQIGSLTNPNKIANTINSASKSRLTSTTVSSYIKAIEDSFLVNEARRFDIKGKSYFAYPSKYYFEDLGLRNSRLNFRQYDPGHLMENLIFNELKTRGYAVDVGVVKERSAGENSNREIDFVVNKGTKKTYIQSALRMDTEDKQATELRSLELAKDFFKKVVIRNDIHNSFYDQQGIFHLSLGDFLLNKESIF